MTTSLAKITRPKYSGVFPRKRLFRLVDHGRKKPVVWICGPPGSGKTVLVSSYIEASKLPCLWYQADGGDADIATFIYYMGLAAKKAAPHRRKSLPLLTPEYLPTLSTFTLRYFENFYNRLKVPSILIFDNYQEISESSLFHQVIRDGLGIIPEGISVIVISRTGPPPLFSRMRANHSMELIGWDELRLTPEESRGIMRLKLKGRQLRGDAQEIHDQHRGWAAGLVLLLEMLKKGEMDVRSLNRITLDTISEYFTSEIFLKIDADTQGFLLKTAFLPGMDAGMAGRLTGLNHADRILSDLYRNNYFTERRLHPNPVYQYHPLFREFLLSKTIDSFTPADILDLQKKAASILEESGRFEDAFGLFRDASDWGGVAGLVLKYAQTLMAQGRNRVLEEWLMSLPQDVLKNNPWLLYWLGVCLIPFNPLQGIVYLEQAFNLFKEQRDVTGVFLSWSWVVHSITHLTLDLKPLDRWIPVLSELINDFEGLPSGDIGAMVANSMFMALVYRQPHHPEIDRWAEDAYNLSKGCSDLNIKAQILINFAYYKARLGDFVETESIITSLQQVCRDKEAPPLIGLLMKWIEATYLSLSGSHESCLKVVSEGLNLADSTGIHMIDFMILGHGALSALNTGDSPSAGKFLKRMASYLISARPVDQGFYHSLMAHHALLSGKITQAASHAELMWKKGKDVGFPVLDYVYHIENAYIMHALGGHEKASYYLEQSRRISQSMKSKPFEFMCLLADTQFAFDRGEDERGMMTLRNAMAFGREHGYTTAYIWFPKVMAGLCCKALDAGIEVKYVQGLIRRRNISPETPPVEIEDWPWAIKIYTLGRFGLMREGRPVKFSRKVPKMPLTMLKAVIALGGRDVREEHLTDTLWSESEGDAAHEAFAINLHRLRQLLGAEGAVFRQEGRVTLDPGYCWVDTWAFERNLGNADMALREGQKERAIRLIEKAISIYKGSFLTDSPDVEWAVTLRERLRSKFLRYTGELGRLYEERGEFSKAIDSFQRGIEVDLYAEEFYRRLMTCYQRLGRRAEAAATYNRLKKTLSTTLGLEPSPETEGIYRRICSGA